MDVSTLGNCRELETLYCDFLSDLKNSTPLWEDIISKGAKLSTALRSTIHASNAFLDSIQKLADFAAKTTGGSKEIGAQFTRLCMRQKRLCSALKTMGNQLNTCMVNPLMTHVDEWKKALSLVEKEHGKEAKQARGDLKRALSEASRLKRKLAKQGNSGGSLHVRQGRNVGSTIGRGVGLGEPPKSCSVAASCGGGVGTSSLAVQTEHAQQILKTKVSRFEEIERSSLRRLMVEERARYCFFFNCYKPFLETETNMLSEVSTLRDLLTALSEATRTPDQLLENAESILARTGGGETRTGLESVGPGATGLSSEAFASALNAILVSSKHQPGNQQGVVGSEASPSLASESLGSTITSSSSPAEWGGNRVGGSSPASSCQMSFHSAASGQMNGLQIAQATAALRQPRSQEPRAASTSRSLINGATAIAQPPPPSRVVSIAVDESDHVFLRPRRPLNLGPQTTSADLASSSTPHDDPNTPSSLINFPTTSNQRHSTCTLQQGPYHSDQALHAGGRNPVGEEDETEGREEEEEAEGTTTSEGGTSDECLLEGDETTSANHYAARRSVVNFGYTISGGSGDDFRRSMRRPSLGQAFDRKQRSLSRCVGDRDNGMLFPDQSLPPPVYTNLNKLTSAAQRKFSMLSSARPPSPPSSPGIPGTLPEGDTLSVVSAPQPQDEIEPVGRHNNANSNGAYSMPGSPSRPSFSTASNSPASRPRKSSIGGRGGGGIEDPFSVEMDELDRMVAGSSAASSLTSRSARSGTNPPKARQSRPLSQISIASSASSTFFATGVPMGLHTATATATASTRLGRSRSRSTSVCASLGQHLIEQSGLSDHEGIGFSDANNAPLPPPLLPPHRGGQMAGATVSVLNPSTYHDSPTPCTAAYLLTQLSGQLQQINSSNLQPQPQQQISSQPQATTTPRRTRNDSSDFDLPAPPSPDMLDDF